MKEIIVEICQNFKGDKDILKKMIYSAAENGATHAKIQSYRSDELTYRPEFEIRNSNGIDRPYKAEFERLKKADLSDDDIFWFVDECRAAGIKPLITIFTRGRIFKLAKLNWDEVKVASYDCASFPMIEELRDCFQHLYISTGASFDDEIGRTAEIMKGHHFTFLHCVTKYPTKLEDCNLARIEWLKQFTPSVGYSDHSLVSRDGILAALAALAMGADVIERHFTVVGAEETRDGPVSINPKQLKELVAWSKKETGELIEYLDKVMPEWRNVVMGSAERKLTDEELRNRKYYRGRFATRIGDSLVFNWENKPIN